MKHSLRTLILLWAGLGYTLSSYGQQPAMFTQYMFNGLAINPAYAGSHGALSLTALARKQWTGFEGSPFSQTFSAHTPLRLRNFSAGALLIHDHIGVTDQTGVTLSGAYQIRFAKAVLSLGAQGGVGYYQISPEELSVRHSTDPTFADGDFSRMMPVVGTGLYYYSDRFYLGLSVPQLLKPSFSAAGQLADQLPRHYFLTSGYVFDLGRSLKLKPNVLVTAVEGTHLGIDLNTNLLIKEVLWVGASYRSFESVDAMLELQLTDQFRLGYSYDFVTAARTNRVNTGSHELMLNYRFSFAKTRLVTPRYF